MWVARVAVILLLFLKPGFAAVTMFRRVALRVNREIGQDPWLAASTVPEHYLAGSKSEEQVGVGQQ
jgi:hypothetical protein